MPRFHFVYRTEHFPSGKFYIGKHSSDTDPKISFDGYFGSGKLINLYLSKYNISEFTREVLASFGTPEDALAYEYFLVNKFLGDPECLNLTEGGKVSGFCVPSFWTKERRQEFSNKTKEVMSRVEVKAKHSEAIRVALSNPSVKAKHIQGIRNATTTEVLIRRGAAISKSLSSPEARIKRSQSVKKTMENQAVRDQISRSVVKALSDPETKRRQLENLRKTPISAAVLLKRYYSALKRVKTLESKMANPIRNKTYRDALENLAVREKMIDKYDLRDQLWL